ncbi:MarR family winged helix-turn-helix transcriptional regulator [Protaetiibacter mangrovi]|uniref:MarR family winged helix-turn-helix transcriptional regulator n=1 Tax=Protaetiibacter mangrovi TaxID=2970926 RepID=A0ABT1ZDK0_9MICO|nr:MarR family winged helix-turn-helix transcriptional regulator [Protaetiibacter mangrovi]MCS0498780.1 MarR family winged helix-turn-helix transcriptional regulator [Protaetiibacter mangrovi]TPX04518.1 winged helix-turn-helix transcriptional regulator [Schumannella luteola]
MSDGSELDELAEALAADVALTLGAAERAARSALFRHLHARGHDAIRPAHLPVFAGLDAGGSRITDLAAHAGLTRQAMGMLVRDVEEAGYVRTGPDPDDGRAVRVELTERGIAFCLDAARSSRAVSAELSERLGAARLDAMLGSARAIASPESMEQ